MRFEVKVNLKAVRKLLNKLSLSVMSRDSLWPFKQVVKTRHLFRLEYGLFTDTGHRSHRTMDDCFLTMALHSNA